MTIFLWCLGIYLAIAVGVFAFVLPINAGHFGGHSIWTLMGIAITWPLWLVGIAGAALYDRYR